MTTDKVRWYSKIFHNVSRRGSNNRWSTYLDEFHARNPGITEDVLSRSHYGRLNPYQWLLAPVPKRGPVLDLACGSSPLFHVRKWQDWVGVDRSWAELERANQRGVAPLISGNATALPFPDESFEAVVCSMAIMLLQPLGDVLAEIRRVLRPGGTAAFMLPGSMPLTASDLFFYSRLMVTLRQTHLAYPNDWHLAHFSKVFRIGGFEMVSDIRARFEYQLVDDAAAQRFVDSLYLPAVASSRMVHAHRRAQRRVGRAIGIPLRRIVVCKAPVQ